MWELYHKCAWVLCLLYTLHPTVVYWYQTCIIQEVVWTVLAACLSYIFGHHPITCVNKSLSFVSTSFINILFLLSEYIQESNWNLSKKPFKWLNYGIVCIIRSESQVVLLMSLHQRLHWFSYQIYFFLWPRVTKDPQEKHIVLCLFAKPYLWSLEIDVCANEISIQLCWCILSTAFYINKSWKANW